MVFVIDTKKKPLTPCHPAEARKLLKQGKAAIWRKAPFTIILNKSVEAEELPKEETRLKIDYGSKHTGMAIVQGERVIWLGVLEHRTNIKKKMDDRRGHRRFRRNKLRYRKVRFDNRKRKEGWLPPSLQSRVDNIGSVVQKLCSLCPVTAIAYENCKFDTQLIQKPEISGVEYQQGELLGYEVREYLLEKYERTCCYCGKRDIPLEVEHIIPKSRGGTNRVDNLCISCKPCNQNKGNQTAEEYGYPDIQKQAKKPLKDAAVVTATRWAVYNRLRATGLPVECGSGAKTKMNRVALGLPKEHYYDACCVGQTPRSMYFAQDYVQRIAAQGRGAYSRTNLDRHGFPRGYLARQKQFFGFQTGDMVKAIVPAGKNKGMWYGRVLCRKTGYFDVKTTTDRKGGINHKNIKLVQQNDGYEYSICTHNSK